MFARNTLLLLVFCVGVSATTEAAYLANIPKTLVQPNGDSIHCFVSGDEFYHWLHDAEGFAITRDPGSGYWVYAQKDGNELIPSSTIVGKDSPSRALIEPNLKISAEEYADRRAAYYSTTSATDAPDSGFIENLVVFVRFKGEDEFATNRADFDSLFNNGKDPIWGGDLSMNSYFNTATYNQLDISSLFYPECEPDTSISYEDSFNRDYYRPDSVSAEGYANDDEKREREHTLVKNALEFIESEITPVWFADSDNDGNVDNITIVIKGSPDEWDDLLWPHQWELTTHTVMLTSLGKDKRVTNYTFTFETDGLGVFCHETFHSIGAPDLYRYVNKSIRPVGPWDIMATNTNPPQHMSAYMKWRHGAPWLQYDEISVSGEYVLKPLNDTSGARAFWICEPGSLLGKEYYMIEYRNNDAKSYERLLPGSGLIVQRINSFYSGFGNSTGPPDEIYVFRPGGTFSDSGDVNQAFFTSDSGRVAFTRRTDPSPFLSDGSAGNMLIADIGPAQSEISFYVGISPIELSGLVYNGIGGPFVTEANPYCLVGDITVPAGQGLAISNGARVYFESGKKITSDGTLFVESGVQWTRLHNIARYKTGLKIKGNIRMQNGGTIKLK